MVDRSLRWSIVCSDGRSFVRCLQQYPPGTKMSDLDTIATKAFYDVNVRLCADTLVDPRHHSRISGIAQRDIVNYLVQILHTLVMHLAIAQADQERNMMLPFVAKIKPTENITLVLNKSLSDLFAILRLHQRLILETAPQDEIFSIHEELHIVALYYNDPSPFYMLDGTTCDATRFFTTHLQSIRCSGMKTMYRNMPDISDCALGREHQKCPVQLCCANCGKKKQNLRVCVSCLSVAYCNEACMNAHWPTHKRDALCNARRKIGKN